MTIDPQVLRSERHGEIGRILKRDSSLLIERWSYRAVDEQPQAARLHHEALLDDLPELLKTLAESLAESTEANDAPHCRPAGKHGARRWEDGWSLSEVVRDYQILRIVIFHHLEQALDRPMTYREVQAVGLALDEAITASIAAYVRQRDEHTRKIEESLHEQAQQLREADRRKNEFLAVLAHELRNPLAPILTSMEVLRLSGTPDANAAQARTIVERQVKHMVRLVDDLLDLTRVAQGKIELRLSTFSVATAVQEAVQTSAPLFRAQNHRLSVHLPDHPVNVRADHARVVQILVNLLNNSAKYTDAGGSIELTAAREGDCATVRVKDNGVGIEPAMLGRVFDMFTREGRSVGRSRGGLGIGLALVRQLVELHGGSVSVHSDGPGKGSEFLVRLPAEPPAAKEPGAAPPAP